MALRTAQPHQTWRYVRPVRIEDPSCADHDPELWFPESRQTPWRALSICGRCDGLEQCATYALQHPELEGVWGGMTDKDRDRVRKKRGSVTYTADR